MTETISWVGCGKVARTLGRGLKEAGYKIGVLYCTRPENAREAVKFIGAGEIGNDLVSAVNSGKVHFLATTDDAMESIVAQIVEERSASLAGHYFYHTSGSKGSEILQPLQKKGAETGSIHPLQVFADPEKALQMLPGTYYAIEGTDRAMTQAIQMVDKLHGKLLLIPAGRKVMYHLAGVFAANYLTVVVSIALGIMEEIGEDPEEAYQALLPLMVGALQSIEELGVGQALTGPIARGDAATIRSHLDALQKIRPDILHVYRLLGWEALEIAMKAGRIPADKAKELTKLLKDESQIVKKKKES